MGNRTLLLCAYTQKPSPSPPETSFEPARRRARHPQTRAAQALDEGAIPDIRPHAEKHMTSDIGLGIDIHRTNPQVGFGHVKGALHSGQTLVGLYRRLRGNIMPAQAGADDIQTVQVHLGSNLLFIAAPTEVLVRDVEVKLLLHFPAVDVAPECGRQYRLGPGATPSGPEPRSCPAGVRWPATALPACAVAPRAGGD